MTNVPAAYTPPPPRRPDPGPLNRPLPQLAPEPWFVEWRPAQAAPPSLPRDGGSLADDARFVARAIRRWWPLILIAAALGGAAAYAYGTLREPVYESASAVLFRQTPTAPEQDPVAGALTPRRPQSSVGNEIEFLARSTPLASRVLDRVRAPGLVAEAAEEAGVVAGALPEGYVADYLLRERVSFSAAGVNSDIIEITATAPTPGEATALAAAYATEYAAFDGEDGESDLSEARSYLEREAADQRAKLRGTEGRLRQFLEAEGVVSLDAQERGAVERSATVEAELADARSQLRLKERELTGLEAEVARVRPGLEVRVGSSASREIAQLQERVATLEAEAADYYAQDPTLRGNEGRNADLQALTARLRTARARIETLSDRYVSQALATGGTTSDEEGAAAVLGYTSELQRDALRRGIEISGLRSKVASLEGRQGAASQRLSGFPRRRVGLAQLEREKSVAEQRYLALTSRLAETQAAEDVREDDVRIVRPAIAPVEPSGPSLAALLALGLLGGTGVGLAAVVGTAALAQNRPQTRADLQALGFVSLGALPRRRHRMLRAWSRGAAESQPFHLLKNSGEAVRQLRTALVHRTDRLPCVVTVTSPAADDGKSSTALALAGSMAQAGLRTLYVDADFRSVAPGGLANRAAHGPGLADLLAVSEPVDWSVYEYSQIPNEAGAAFSGLLYTIPSGAYGQDRDDPAVSELLVHRRAEQFVEEARQAFDVVIFDTPPVLAVVDPLIVAAHSDVFLLVIAAGQTSEAELGRVRERLDDLGGALPPTVGVVLNGVAPETVPGVHRSFSS